MAISYTQTDTAAPCGTIQACAGSAVSSFTADGRQAESGGTAGVTERTVEVNRNSQTPRSTIMFEATPAAGVTWAAGTWTIRLNVTTSSADLTWTAVYVCRLNSSCTSQGTIGSSTFSEALSSSGVKTQTVSGSSQTPSAGDKFYVVLELTNGAPGSRTMGYTPDQNIDTPLVAPSSPVKPRASTTLRVNRLGRMSDGV